MRGFDAVKAAKRDGIDITGYVARWRAEGEMDERRGAEMEERTLALRRFLPFRSRWPANPFRTSEY